MTAKFRRRRFVAGCLGAVVLVAVVIVGWLLLTAPECTGYCLTDEGIDLVHELEADPLFTAPPPGATDGDAQLTTTCDPSGGWLGVRTWETPAAPAVIADFYTHLALDHGWSPTDVPLDLRPSALDTYLNNGSGSEVTATVLRLPLSGDGGATPPGVRLVFRSPSLDASCAEWQP